MPDQCWLYLLLVYCLLSYTLLWRLFVWATDMPKPDKAGDKIACLLLWLLCPTLIWLFVPALLFGCFAAWLANQDCFRCLAHIPIWLAFGGRKRDGSD
jgi:hypothetical protein